MLALLLVVVMVRMFFKLWRPGFHLQGVAPGGGGVCGVLRAAEGLSLADSPTSPPANRPLGGHLLSPRRPRNLTRFYQTRCDP